MCRIMEFNVLVLVSKQVEKRVPDFKTTIGLDWFSFLGFGKLELVDGTL